MNMFINACTKPGIRAKQIICLALVVTFLLLCFPIPTQAARKNAIAREAYLKALTSGKLVDDWNPWSCTVQYAFYDIDGDGIDELIGYPGYGAWTYEIFTYLNGKIKPLVGEGQALETIEIFPATKVLAFVGFGHKGYTLDNYYTVSGGKVALLASMVKNTGLLSGEKQEDYYIKGKKTTKTEYNKYVNTLKKGTRITHYDLKWEYSLVTDNNDYSSFNVDRAAKITTLYVAYRALRTGNVYFSLRFYSDYTTKVQVTLMNSNKKKINISIWDFAYGNTKIPNPFTYLITDYWDATFACKLEKNKIYYIKITTTNKKTKYGYNSSFILKNYNYQPY